MCTGSMSPRSLALVAMLLDRDMKTDCLPVCFRRTGKALPTTAISCRPGLPSSKTDPALAGRVKSAKVHHPGNILAAPAELGEGTRGHQGPAIRVLPSALCPLRLQRNLFVSCFLSDLSSSAGIENSP